MHALDASPMTDRSPLGSAVRSRSWEWLFALRKRLNVDLQLVDDAQVPLMTASAATATTEGGAPMAAAAPGVALAVSTALRTRSPQATSVDRLQTVIVPVTLDRVVSGALLVSRRTAETQPLERVRSELELVGFWLTSAIEAHLQSSSAAESDLERLSALCKLLADASLQGSDRDIVAAFVETLAVWHDFEGYGYIETPHEEYARDVTLPGVDMARTPALIARASLPDVDELSRLARSDMERAGFSSGDELVLARIGEGMGSWLVAVAGSIQLEDLPRLGLYVDLLDQAVARGTQHATATLLATLSKHLLVDADNPEEQARRALREVQAALGMRTAGFTVTSRTGAPFLHVGASYTAADLKAGSDVGRIVVIRRDPRQYAMALVGNWSSDHRVTQQQHHLVEAVADVLESWVQRLVSRSARGGDRRATQRSFDDVMERAARDAVRGGVPVTAIVLAFGDAALRPDVTRARVLRLREQLRGGDLVGRLEEGDVGVLLQDTVATQADALIARIRRLLEHEGVPLGQVTIGMASRSPGDQVTGALADEAREKAWHGAGRN